MKAEKLHKKLKARWVKALRSGKYEQGFGQLATQVGGKTQYCCLGVLNEVAKLGADTGEALLADNDPRIDIRGLYWEVENRLAEFNDGTQTRTRKSFNWIAAYIERYL
jgi:hypothetical protein